MLYLDDKIGTYPNKTAIEDVLSRDGNCTENSFSPFNGMQFLIKEQNLCEYTLEQILESVSSDYNPNKSRPNSDSVQREEYASEIVDYYTRLEDIEEDYIKKYVKELLIGFKSNNNGRRRFDYAMQLNDDLREDDEGELTELSELLLREEDFTFEEILSAKSELPHLLRTLRDGSIEYGFHMLSVIIAFEAWSRSYLASGYVRQRADLKPIDLYSRETYSSDYRGEVYTKFTAQSNTGKLFPEVVRWIRGECTEDIYYRTYKRLIVVLDILDIDITREDPTLYSNEVLERSLNSFIQTNAQYVKDYGHVDTRIMKLLEVESLFTVQSKLSDVVSTELSKNWRAKINFIQQNYEALSRVITEFDSIDAEALRELINWVCNRERLEKIDSNKYCVIDGVVCKRGEQSPLCIRVPVNKLRRIYVYLGLTVSGHLIELDNQYDFIRYVYYKDFFNNYYSGRKDKMYIDCWKEKSL